MAKFEFKPETNPTTGERMFVATMQGKLVSIATNPLNNANGNAFYPATVEYENAEGVNTKSGCLVYKNNYDYGMSVGTTYLGKVIVMPGKAPLLVLSHLDRASQATVADFGFDLSLLETTDFDAVPKK